MIINHNIAAIFSHRTLKFHDWSLTKDIEKL
ncbi:MAG: flagellin, partial [Leptospirales bacterium]|nr:flagellin [Leptospirales bacterium]